MIFLFVFDGDIILGIIFYFLFGIKFFLVLNYIYKEFFKK